MWLTSVIVDWLPVPVSAWMTDDGEFFFSDAQIEDIAEKSFAHDEAGRRSIERRLTGGWLERRLGQEPITMPRWHFEGQDFFRPSGDWRPFGPVTPLTSADQPAQRRLP